MGIFVPSATLPSGVTVSNVYMSFSNEVVYLGQLPAGYVPQPSSAPPKPAVPPPPGGPPLVDTSIKEYPYRWRISSTYKVYSGQTSRGNSEIKIHVEVDINDLNTNPYGLLYNKLKAQYPGSTDVIEPNQVPSNIVISPATLDALYTDLSGTVESGVTLPLSAAASNELSDTILKLKATETLGS
jgi:hypothetical protein